MPRRDTNMNERDRLKRAAGDPQFLARKREASRRYYNNPENRQKIAARTKVKHLCKAGKIKRGDCEGCGKPNAEAHHVDYSQPLNVRWLCRQCHVLEHKKLAAE